MRSVALILVTTLFASACTMSKSSKSTVTILGIATAAAGVALVAAGPDEVDSNHNGVNEWSLNDDYSKPVFGSLLVLAGLATLIGGLTATTPEDEPRPILMPPPMAVAETAPVAVTVRAPGATLPMTKAPLPEVAVDDETLRLAKTMRHVATVGNCEAAAMLLDRIAARSHDYYRALVSGPVLDPCPQLRPRTDFGNVD